MLSDTDAAIAPDVALPADPGKLTFLLLSIRTPAVAEFAGPDP